MQAFTPALTILSLAAGLTITPVHAQVSATSPAGFENAPGNSTTTLAIGSILGNWTTRQSLVIDGTQRGKAGAIKALWLRRSMQVIDNTSSIASKLDMTLRIGEGDFSKVKFGRQAFSDFVVGAWTTGLAARKIDMPDLRKRPATGPAPWSLRLPLDRPFNYSGKNALLVQLNAFGTQVSPFYPFDASRANSRSVSGNAVGTGCRIDATEFTAAVDTTVTAGVPTAFMFIRARPYRRSSIRPSTFALLGATNPKLKIPGLCASLLSSGEIVVTMTGLLSSYRSSTPIGRSTVLNIPYSNTLVGIRVFAQVITIDSSAPGGLVVTRGFHTAPFPARPPATTRPYGGFTMTVIRGTSAFLSSAMLTSGSSTILGIER